MTKPSQLNFVFGFRSPYAWLANIILDRINSEADGQRVSFIPYWNPAPDTVEALSEANSDFLYREMSKDRHLYILRDVKRLAAQFDAPLCWPVDPPSQEWERPHCLYLKACIAGKSRQARNLIFASRWSEGKNICDPEILAKIAEELDVSDYENLPLSDRIVPLNWCYGKRVFGLPFFVVSREKYWGFDRLPFALRDAGLPSKELEKLWFSAPQLEEMA